MLFSKILNHRAVKYLLRTSSVHFSHDSKYLSFKQYKKVAMIGINRPEKRNALNENMVKNLGNLIQEFENDENFLVGVLYGEGGNFCAGYDLEELADHDGLPQNFMQNDFTDRYIKKPLIAAVNGFAVGFGFDLALFCDLRIMDETAVYGCYGRRYGTSMSEAGIGRLHATVGLSIAMDLILTGRSVRSNEALKYGLANQIVSCGTAVGQALRISSDITKNPESSMLSDRATLYKQAFSKIRLRNSIIDQDSERYREQMLKDSKKGAKLFTKGFGKKGIQFPQYVWNDS